MNEMTHAKATAQTARGCRRMLGAGVVPGDEFTVDSSRGVVDAAS